eukprot:m.100198 g.100198  ORF g.100198 m.100198 type:complete len:61 (+) comp9040_c1_seq4:2054-2236(+)
MIRTTIPVTENEKRTPFPIPEEGRLINFDIFYFIFYFIIIISQLHFWKSKWWTCNPQLRG